MCNKAIVESLNYRQSRNKENEIENKGFNLLLCFTNMYSQSSVFDVCGFYERVQCFYSLFGCYIDCDLFFREINL